MFEKIKGLSRGYANDPTKQLMDSLVNDKVRASVEYLTGQKSEREVGEDLISGEIWDKAADAIKAKGFTKVKAKIAAKYGLKTLAKVVVGAKVVAAVAVVVVVVGTGYYVYDQLTQKPLEVANPAGNGSAILEQSPSPAQNQNLTPTPSETPTETPSDTPSDPVNTGDNAPAAPSDNVFSGTYIDDFSGSLIFTFTGDTVTMDFDGWVIEGTFTAENGVLFIDTSEPSMFSHRNIPFTVEGDGDAFIIDGGNKFTRQ